MGHNFGAELPLRWDAGWYLGIVHRGYRWTGRIHDQQNLNFFPGYPLTARYAAQLFHFHTVPLYIVVARPDHSALKAAPLSAAEFARLPLASAGLTPDFRA